MREDMFKVIVERPRKGGAYSRDGRRFRADEEVPAKIGMRRGYRCNKYLNENLAPLKRYLESQVNRPWDKVYSDICANIDRRNTVQQHIFQHIDQFVALKTHLRADGIYVEERWGKERFVPLQQAYVRMYVHPRTGLLLRNVHYRSYNTRRRTMRASQAADLTETQRPLDARRRLEKVDEVWYVVDLEELPPARILIEKVDGVEQTKFVSEVRWDVVRKCMVRRETISAWRAQATQLYACAKRQLSTRELREYGLK